MVDNPPSQVVLSERTRREILHKSDFVPPLSKIVVRLLAILEQPDTEPEDVQRLIENDPVLVARMLTVVNSPFFGRRRPVRGVRDAVMVLGFHGVRALVLATATTRFMQRELVYYGHEPRGLWTHAVCVGAGARALARTCGVDPDRTEAAFIAGLLHDIGKVLLVQYLPPAAPVDDAAPDGCAAAERALIGIDHAEAGAMCAAKWSLPQDVQDLIASHHVGGTSSRLAAIVRVADAVAHGLGAGYVPGRAPASDLEPADLAALRLDCDPTTLRKDLATHMREAVCALARIAG